uniref:acyl carrier protein n=1 Tax=Actinomadura rifamycini TaxID=31962 RepID=UPI0012F8A1E9
SRMSRRGGLQLMSQAEGMELFEAALGSGRSLLVPARIDLRSVRADAAAGGAVPHMLRGLVRAGRQAAHTATADDERGRLPERLAGLPAAEREKVLLDLVRAQVAAVLGYGASDRIDADQGLFELGFDSLTAIELRNRLNRLTDRKVVPNLVFAYPTPESIAAYLHDLVLGDHEGDREAAPVAVSV